MRANRRTDIDFSEHKYTCTEAKDELGDIIRVDSLELEGTVYKNVNFMNTKFGMVVFSEYGVWSFNRCFIPNGSGELISDDYWISKLTSNLCEMERNFDKDLIKEHLSELAEEISDFGLDEDVEQDALEWVSDLMCFADCEDWDGYMDIVYHEESDMYAPVYKKAPYRLNAIFDAFEEICHRIKNKEYGN